METQDKAVALKAVVQYFCNHKSVCLGDFYREHPQTGQNGFDQQQAGTKFFRSNCTPDHYRKEYQNFLLATQRVIEIKGLRIPPHMYDIARYAGLKILETERSRWDPHFIDIKEVPKLTGDLQQMMPLLDAYAGCWRTYRLSSADGAGEPLINVGFLSIMPLSALERARLNVPHFMFFQRSEPIGVSHRGTSKIYGLMVRTGECVTLLGERAKGGGAGMPYIGMLCWQHIETDEPSRRPFDGLCCIPNSGGNRVFSTYFCAEFIDNSDQYDKETDYQAFKEEQVSARKIGQIPWGDLKLQLSEEMRNTVENLIQRNREHAVFHL